MAQRIWRSDPNIERIMDGTRQMRGHRWPDNGGTGERCDCAEKRAATGDFRLRMTVRPRKNEIQSGCLFQIILPDRITPLPLQSD